MREFNAYVQDLQSGDEVYLTNPQKWVQALNVRKGWGPHTHPMTEYILFDVEGETRHTYVHTYNQQVRVRI